MNFSVGFTTQLLSQFSEKVFPLLSILVFSIIIELPPPGITGGFKQWSIFFSHENVWAPNVISILVLGSTTLLEELAYAFIKAHCWEKFIYFCNKQSQYLQSYFRTSPIHSISHKKLSSPLGHNLNFRCFAFLDLNPAEHGLQPYKAQHGCGRASVFNLKRNCLLSMRLAE